MALWLATNAALTLTLAMPGLETRTTWRLRVSGSACSESSLSHFDDAWPVHNTSNTFDVFIDSGDMSTFTLQSACEVVEREQGRPGREFLVPDGYMPPEEMDEVFRLLALTHPERAQFIDLTDSLNAPPTQEGRHIYALKVSDNVQVDEDEPNLLLVGMHHAREIMGPETVLFAARQLLERGSKHSALVDGNQIYLAWDWNPDGWRYVFNENNNWRKNRLQNPDGSFGVDLNRNYPFGWDFSCGGSTNPSSGTFRGPGPGSEPEMQTMVLWQADRKFDRLVDLHSFGRDVRQNYAECAELPDILDTMYTGIVSAVAEDMGYVPVRSCCTGGEISYAFSTHGTMSILFEQGTSFQPPYEDTMRELELENWPGILNFFTIPTPASGNVVDAVTGAGIPNAELRSIEIAWNYGEFVSTSPAGRYHLWLPSGTYQISVNATGYAPSTLAVTASRTTGVVTNIPLTPLSMS